MLRRGASGGGALRRVARVRWGSSLSTAAVAAYSCKHRAAGYDALRPDYPAALIAAVAARLPREGTVVDLGAGAGRLTRALMPAVAGRDVLAVEPSAAMRGAFSAEGVDCVDVSGDESLPVQDGHCAAVVCGESFHWMDNAATLAYIHRAL